MRSHLHHRSPLNRGTIREAERDSKGRSFAERERSRWGVRRKKYKPKESLRKLRTRKSPTHRTLNKNVPKPLRSLLVLLPLPPSLLLLLLPWWINAMMPSMSNASAPPHFSHYPKRSSSKPSPRHLFLSHLKNRHSFNWPASFSFSPKTPLIASRYSK